MQSPQPNDPQRRTKRRWLSYSLRTLLILVTALSVWLGIRTRQVHRQRTAVAAIEASGGLVRYDFQILRTGKQQQNEPPGPEWLRELIGDEFFQDVVEVRWFGNEGIEAGDLRWIADFPKIERLSLNVTNVDDKGLEKLAELTTLKHLLLEYCTGVTDRGLAHLIGLENLEWLTLLSTSCSDEGIRQYVPRFQRLEYLDVSGIPITVETAKQFQHLKSLRMLHLSRFDHRPAHDLSEAVELLTKELPGCQINYWPPESTDG